FSPPPPRSSLFPYTTLFRSANLRRQMQIELKTLQREVGITFMFVTHDQEEAMVMSDRIALLHAGELEQVAAPAPVRPHEAARYRSEEHTSELQSLRHLVCRL